MISLTATRLQQLAAGERAWFWFSEPARDGVKLRISSLAEDPDGARLRSETTGAAPIEQAPTFGFVQVDNDGRIHFAANSACDSLLQKIAGFAVAEVGEHPGLARLRGATVTRIEGDMALERAEDAALWAGMPTALVPGTLPHTASILSGLKSGESAFFWATPGADGWPMLLLGQADAGEAFGEQVRIARRRSGELPWEVWGAVTVLESGRLCFTTDDSGERVRLCAAHLLRAEGSLSKLANAVFIGSEGQCSFEPDELDAALVERDYSDSTVFWLTDAGVHGLPQLVLAADPDQITARISVAQGAGKSWTGRVRHSEKGTTFRVARNASQVQLVLSAFLSRTTLTGLPRTRVISKEGK